MELNNKFSWRNPYAVIALAGILTLGAIITISILRDRIVNNPQWQVSISGQGKVSYQPDIANLNLGVQVDKVDKPETALNQLNEKMNKVISSIKQSGINEADIQTQSYTLNPHYDLIDNNSKVTGYDASQIVIVKVRGIKEKNDLVSKVIAEASKAGVNKINSISFEPSNMNELKQEARILAIKDAKDKADTIAAALGVRLGDITGWWENITIPYDNSIYSADGKGGAGIGGVSPSIPSGQQEVSVDVNISYELK